MSKTAMLPHEKDSPLQKVRSAVDESKTGPLETHKANSISLGLQIAAATSCSKETPSPREEDRAHL